MTKSAKPLPELKRRVLSPKQNRLPNFKTGARGEALAKQLLISKGYQILAENIASGQYEIDLVARDRKHQEIVFVEVKTRESNEYGDPSNAVDWKKLRALRKIAARYLRSQGLRNLYRFDIIAVTPGRVEHFENITWP